MKHKFISLLLAIISVLMLLTGCAAGGTETGFLAPSTPPVEVEYLEDEAVALSEAPAAVSTILTPERGDEYKENARAVIDYSHISEGYVMAQVKKDSGKRWKAQVKGPSTTYTYNLTPEEWEVFPMSDGNGEYKIVIYENVSGSSYASVISVKRTVTMEDEFSPFLYPNQYVNYSNAPKTVEKAAELTEDCENALEKVAEVYDYVVKELVYDKKLAKSVKSGYLPDLDAVLAKKSGICFDYAALMAGMLRSQDVPCKLVVGYAGTVYHAWISVWTEEDGWIENVVYFDGSAWQRMDPTFASSSKNDPAILRYIGDGSNYTSKYIY